MIACGRCVGLQVKALAMQGSVLAMLLAAYPMCSRAQVIADPVADASGAPLERDIHTPLPEQYVWTATASDSSDADRIQYVFPKASEQTEPHFFRASFQVEAVPHDATLYVAGPRSVEVYLNGQLVERVESDITQPLGMHVFAAHVAPFLHAGRNVLAMKVVRGRGVTGFTNSALVMQQTFGEVVVAKIVPRPAGVMAPALMMSGPAWKSILNEQAGWQKADFDDASWAPVHALGGIESSLDLFQWNADAGMYDWPGYDGISPFLAHRRISAASIVSLTEAGGEVGNAKQLTEAPPNDDLVVHLPAAELPTQEAPNVILDFGHEVTGRLELVSDTDTAAKVTVQYGESYDEMMKSPYLGIDLLTVAPHTTAHGPKSSFRFAKISFLGGARELRFKSIAADDIFYPVTYRGSFESSDPMLNRIWAVSAYTAHACMQDDVWDSPKRDRGRWMGDTDVMGRTIEDVFDDQFLMEDTLDRLLGTAPVEQHVNGIPGSSAAWFTGVAQYVRTRGVTPFLAKTHDRMLQLLHYVDAEFDQRNLYVNKTNVWLFVDWSPELNGDTAESRRATTLEFYGAYRDAAFLLKALGDMANAEHYEQRAALVKAAAEKYLIDPASGSFGNRWQTNAAAVVSGVADPSQYGAIWSHSLASVGHVRYNSLVTTPYYGYYILSAMAKMNHREDALAWMRQYWGGMLAEGATSMWEAYDPDWFKDDFHASLQADNRSGYFVSLAHGWSSGPAPWLMEQVLGIQSQAPGFSKVTIRPDLLDLTWAHGAEPTPHGLLSVSMTGGDTPSIQVQLPPGVDATVSVPLLATGSVVMVNGSQQPSTPVEEGKRATVELSQPGTYTLSSR
jgi:alpha-L-rhamnosidase